MRKIHLLCAALLSAATLLPGCGHAPVTPETPSGDYISNASRSATAVTSAPLAWAAAVKSE